jgi:hypothetical protein
VTAQAAAVGQALADSAGEALRLWRAARRRARPRLACGLLDDLVEGFARAVGGTYAEGRGPEAAWSELQGRLRVLPAGTLEELEAEWSLAGEAVSAVADALKAGPEARQHAQAAAQDGLRRSGELAASAGPTRGAVLLVHVLSTGQPRR